ncbi:MAG TPA: pantoate--beta-alanine ligase [Candidatus Caenarcaniphilales bacterium]|nr:pantoate--beta-alanine ligase [Candidatus Caenarcaniphilales bacterium]
MKVVRSRAALAAARAGLGGPVGFVPTMGALHAGHSSLLRSGRAESASLVASIFVNPTQFGAGEDFERYPRDEAADLGVLEAAGTDVAFLPAVDEIYPAGASTSVDVGRLGEVLEGAARPGHFRGVATVVTILFSLVRPERAYFGQKDGQQVVVLKRLVRDLGLTPEIVVCPTVRDPDGLALSSRNRYLSSQERAAAPVLHRALRAAADLLQRGEHDAEHLRHVMRSILAETPLATADYVSVADAETLEELASVDRPALASLAVRFSSARLIDCLPLDPSTSAAGS